MGLNSDIRIARIATTREQIEYRTPMKFGGRVVEGVTLFHVSVEVETRDGRRGCGLGSMPMGNVWAWPSSVVSADLSLAAMIALADRCAAAAESYSGFGHPLAITQDLCEEHAALAESVRAGLQLSEPIPRLAQLVAASPLEAALYNAYGQALEASAYRLLGPDFVGPEYDLSRLLGKEFAGEYLDKYVLSQPKAQMPLYHLVGALDPLTPGDLSTPVNDGLPESLGEWIRADGLTHLKIKLAGEDLAWDVDRVARVESVAAEACQGRGCREWHYSLDFNEKCADVQYVLDFLAQLGERDSHALGRVQYIEQPTHRDLRAYPENRVHAAAKIKPVVIDESLVDLESLLLAREQGYSGVALKACKGHSEALLMGAAAQKFGLFLCVQDLTCVGASFLHSAGLAAWVPTVAAIEGNGRQYCPAGNRDWVDRFPGMFKITDGTVHTAELDGPGLGF